MNWENSDLNQHIYKLKIIIQLPVPAYQYSDKTKEIIVTMLVEMEKDKIELSASA